MGLFKNYNKYNFKNMNICIVYLQEAPLHFCTFPMVSEAYYNVYSIITLIYFRSYIKRRHVLSQLPQEYSGDMVAALAFLLQCVNLGKHGVWAISNNATRSFCTNHKDMMAQDQHF